jgi:hypothetical protein
MTMGDVLWQVGFSSLRFLPQDDQTGDTLDATIDSQHLPGGLHRRFERDGNVAPTGSLANSEGRVNRLRHLFPYGGDDTGDKASLLAAYYLENVRTGELVISFQ